MLINYLRVNFNGTLTCVLLWVYSCACSLLSWRLLHRPTLLPAIQPEKFSSSSKIAQLLQMGILHFKHLYFVVLKHELHMSASLELVTESLARQAAMFFSSTLFYACFEGMILIPIEKIFSNRDSIRKAREAFLIQKGRTIDPDGLNIREETY